MSTTLKLAAPGAGLPAIELLIGRFMFKRALKSQGREQFTQAFIDERQRIGSLVDGCEPSMLGKQVLIKRLRGLEDSSRNWSVLMTLDHLRICNGVFRDVIKGLSQGVVPEKQASTADVKPSIDVGPDVRLAYEQTCDDWLNIVAGISDLHTDARYAHPWFGLMDASGWHALGALHMKIHRGQIERIIEGMRR